MLTDSFNYTPASFISELHLITPNQQNKRANSKPRNPTNALPEKIK